MPDDLYTRDALAWAQRQADLLARLSRGERVNDAIDWDNVIEEVHDVGLSQLRACRSLLLQAMLHLLKLHAWPGSRSIESLKQEVGAFLDDAAQHFAPSMRQHVDLADLYARAIRRLRDAADDSGEAEPPPPELPWTLDDLLAGEIAALLALVRRGD